MYKLKESGSTDERLRLEALEKLRPEIGPEESYDRIARLVRETLNFPASILSLVGRDQHIIKSFMPDGSCVGSLEDNFCACTVRGRQTLIVPDAKAEAPFKNFPSVLDAPNIAAYWGVPLVTQVGHAVGALAVMDFVSRYPSERDLRLLSEYADLAIELMELRSLASIDTLTGLQVRRTFLTLADNLCKTAVMQGQPLSCVVLDVDNFKTINDRFGHKTGDKVLAKIGEILSSEILDQQVVGRTGGEEFAIILPGILSAQAMKLAERIRARIENERLQDCPHFTASFGVSEMAENLGLSDILERADIAMYSAKRTGRNRVEPYMANLRI